MSGSTTVAEDEVEITEEMRQAHNKAFEGAVALLEAELKHAPGAGQVIAVLQNVQNDFAQWEDGQIDGPLPPLATLETLRIKFKYVLVNKQVWKLSPDYTSKVHKIVDSHMGGGTSMPPKLFAVFSKGFAAIKSALRSGSHERALCDAIALTKAMADNDDWYADTDIPEVAAKVVKALAGAWSDVLSAALDERPWDSLLSWLAGIQQVWQGEASAHLGVKLAFAFEAKKAKPAAETNPSTPAKKRSCAGLAVDGQGSAEPASSSKKRKNEGQGQGKQASIAKADADTEAWLHRLDAELSKRQASVVQLHCEAEGCTQKRALVVSGSYPLRAVGFALAEAFGKAADDFDPHPNKGKTPAGLLFSLDRGGKPQKLTPTLKIVQAVQDPGDSLRMDMDGLSLNITLDVIKFKGGAGYDMIKNRPLPRCVGGDKALTQNLLKKLNRTFLHDRKGEDFLGCSKKEQVDAVLEGMGKPIALRRGEALVEGFGFGMFDEGPGVTPAQDVHPLAL